jgi:hypothetical protein
MLRSSAVRLYRSLTSSMAFSTRSSPFSETLDLLVGEIVLVDAAQGLPLRELPDELDPARMLAANRYRPWPTGPPRRVRPVLARPSGSVASN